MKTAASHRLALSLWPRIPGGVRPIRRTASSYMLWSHAAAARTRLRTDSLRFSYRPACRSERTNSRTSGKLFSRHPEQVRISPRAILGLSLSQTIVESKIWQFISMSDRACGASVRARRQAAREAGGMLLQPPSVHTERGAAAAIECQQPPEVFGAERILQLVAQD